MALAVEEYSDPQTFSDRVSPFLAREEAANNLVFGIVHRLVNKDYAEDAYMALVRADGEVVLVVVQTPPFNLVLSTTTDSQAGTVLARHLAHTPRELPGVTGPQALTAQFIEEWRTLREVTAHIQVAERIYELTEVHPVRNPGGRMRPAAPADGDLITSWIADFASTSLVEVDDPCSFAEATVARRMSDADSGFYLWEDDGPMSLLGYTGPTPSGIRVAPVYTPAHLRGRGYASRLVAEASQALLDAGRCRVFLFTDLSNPTSNHIYQQVGYRAVCDVSQWAF